MKGRLEAATPGPWEVDNLLDVDADGTYELAHVWAHDPDDTDNSVLGVALSIQRPDAAFIAAAPTDVSRLINAVEAVLAVHEPVDALMNPGRHERIVKVCTGCGTDDGNWQRYPCPTVTAVENALNPKEAQ